MYRTQDFTRFCKLQTALVRDGLMGETLLEQLLLKRRRGLEKEVVFLGPFKRLVGKLAAKLFDGVLGIANGELFGKKARPSLADR